MLVEGGYSQHAIRLRLWQLDHLSRWLDEERLGAGELTEERGEWFLADRRARGYRTWVSSRSMRLPLGYLRSIGVAPDLRPPDGDARGDVLGGYRRYLVNERGLATKTVTDYVRTARVFLERYGEGNGDGPAGGLGGVNAAAVTVFVARECAHRSVPAAKYLVAGLRSFLRYLHVSGHVTTDLAAAAPGVAQHGSGTLPRSVPVEWVQALLASCDRARPVGLRDFAILLLLSRLGLRCAEVAALGVRDIDWHRGELTVHGKGNAVETMPLPSDVGEALAAYLLHARPSTSLPTVFLRVRAPRRALAPCGVGAVVHDASVRAGLPKLVSAHQLRHSLGTAVLQTGSSLAAVAQVLRHRDRGSTVIYAKVDQAALQELVVPWPGARS
jgi:site-specific recombinase XerD